MTHTDKIDQVDDPRMQTHELRPTTIAEAQSSMEHRERREKKEVREERER